MLFIFKVSFELYSSILSDAIPCIPLLHDSCIFSYPIGLGNLSAVALLPLLIYGFKLGITGAAISTVASQ